MGLLNWMRGGGEWRRWARDVGQAGDRAFQLASWERAEQLKAHANEEQILTSEATFLTHQWVALHDRLQGLSEAGFSNRDLRELRQEASERRADALGSVSLVQGRNVDRGIYQPVYNIFQEMVDAQVEIWDSTLTTLDSLDPNNLESFNPSNLDSVSYLLRHCGWLGEQVLISLPDLTRQRREAERKKQRLAAIGCTGLVAVVVLCAGLMAYCT